MFMFSCADALKLSWQALECVTGAGGTPERRRQLALMVPEEEGVLSTKMYMILKPKQRNIQGVSCVYHKLF